VCVTSLSSLGSTAAATTRGDRTGASAATGGETSSSSTGRVLVEATAALARWAIETTTGAASDPSTATRVKVASRATLLDVHGVTAELVRVGSDCGLEASEGAEFDESAVLWDCQLCSSMGGALG
jgi:hypothetical protein